MDIVLNDMVRSHYSSSAISNHGTKCPDCWKALNTTLRCSSDWFWITSTVGIEGQLIVKLNVTCKMHPFWQTIISSLPLNIPSIHTPKFPSAYKSDASHGDRNALVFFHQTAELSITQRAGKKTATTPSCSPRNVYEENWAPAFQLCRIQHDWKSPTEQRRPEHRESPALSTRITATSSSRAWQTWHPGGREPTFDLLSKVKQSKTQKKLHSGP